MDSQKFDKLTRAFASGIDRRTLLKFIGGATAAGAASVVLPHANGVFAQGSVPPGGECTTADDCQQGDCYVAVEGEPGVCYCSDPDRPEIGCGCNVDSDCGGTTVCCNNACVSGSVGCNPTGQCSAPNTSCEETGCCDIGECSETGWCDQCPSGTDDPCDAFGTGLVCCTYGGALGAPGYCVTEAQCVVSPPNTGAGTTDTETAWIAPAAAVGAAAVVLAYKSREQKTDTES